MPQLQEREREVQPQREVLGQLVLAEVLVEVCLLHVPQRKLQPLAGQQPLVQVVPAASRQEAPGGVAALDVEGALGLAGGTCSASSYICR